MPLDPKPKAILDNDENPFLASTTPADVSERQSQVDRMERYHIRDHHVSEWVTAWLGTALSGLFFVLYLWVVDNKGFPFRANIVFGSIGFLTAAAYGIPIFGSAVAAIWSFSMLRWNRPLLVVAGAVTGAFSSAFVLEYKMLTTTALFGGLGAAAGVFVLAKRKSHDQLLASSDQAELRFSVFGLVGRVAVGAAVLAAWIIFFLVMSGLY